MLTAISPHFDDAAFSIAATLKLFSSAKCPVRLVNCFTVTQFAPYLRNRGKLSVAGWRRHEDQTFAWQLGNSSESVELGLVDAPSRPGVGLRGMVLRGPATNEATEMIDTLVEAMDMQEPAAPVLAPLALGRHVDHYIARQAALVKYGQSPLAFYEDLPYAASHQTHEIEAAVRAISRSSGILLHPLVVRWPGDRAWKLQCCSLYKSQISQAGIEAILGYMDKVNGERLWCSQAFLESWAGVHAAGSAGLRFWETPEYSIACRKDYVGPGASFHSAT
jgi:LmbE family N-acetylglucosaminyl deacetylase